MAGAFDICDGSIEHCDGEIFKPIILVTARHAYEEYLNSIIIVISKYVFFLDQLL